MATSTSKPKTSTKARSGGRTTKKQQLIKLLGTKSGADIKSLCDKLGWQQHTTRAAVSGLRKAGYEVAIEKPPKGGLSKYRILSAPTTQQATAIVTEANGS